MPDLITPEQSGDLDLPASVRQAREVEDAKLAAAQKKVDRIGNVFYAFVLVVALGGQASGIHEQFELHPALGLLVALPMELGGVWMMYAADLRRRLNEQAVVPRLLSAAFASGTVAFAWFSHGNKLVGGFCAGFSAAGYLVYLLRTEFARRDRLRALGMLPPPPPSYELVGHWLRHPWVTLRARSLAKSDGLGLYASWERARTEFDRAGRERAIAKVLHRKIRASVDRTTADIATRVYDLEQVARRLAAGADYDRLTGLVAVDLLPARIAGGAGEDAAAAMAAELAEARAELERVGGQLAERVAADAGREGLAEQLAELRASLESAQAERDAARMELDAARGEAENAVAQAREQAADTDQVELGRLRTRLAAITTDRDAKAAEAADASARAAQVAQEAAAAVRAELDARLATVVELTGDRGAAALRVLDLVEQLRAGERLNPADVAAARDITMTTARRDLAKAEELLNSTKELAEGNPLVPGQR